MPEPEVSVLLPIYNDEAYVAEALTSIQHQSFENYEVIAIDDGSTDNSAEVVAQYASEDPRIKLFRQENVGLGSTLNRAIDLAGAPLLARHDADDRSHPARFKLQVEYFSCHENISMLGTGTRVIGTDGSIKYAPPVLTGNTNLKNKLKSSSPFAHGSVIMKRNLVVKANGYPSIIWLEDLVLWRALARLGEIENLEDPLYEYRVAPENLYVPRALQKRVVKLFNETWPDDNFSPSDLKTLESIRKQITPKVRKTQFHLNLAKGLLLNTELKWEARKNLILALNSDPLRLESWFQFALSWLPQSIARKWQNRRTGKNKLSE
jgi:glycosyltransferase involved in cell wall biosynthesis